MRWLSESGSRSSYSFPVTSVVSVLRMDRQNLSNLMYRQVVAASVVDL